MKPFAFKQFNICQDKTAMKVGTDGVLLGAWVAVGFNPNSLLDIGTGTGLIALMMAQRTDAEIIDAIELDDAAFEQAFENFEKSLWNDRLYVYHTALQKFAKQIDETYDLIISNPPFFQENHQIKSKKRTIARHHTTLTYADLLQGVAKLLSQTGQCAFIIPFADELTFLDLALKNGLYPLRITRVKGNEITPIKRSLMQFSFVELEPQIDHLTIEISRNHYTDAYKNLVKDFYLKL